MTTVLPLYDTNGLDIIEEIQQSHISVLAWGPLLVKATIDDIERQFAVADKQNIVLNSPLPARVQKHMYNVKQLHSNLEVAWNKNLQKQ